MNAAEVSQQSLVEVMKNLRERVRDEGIDRDTAYPDWVALFSEWDREGTPSYTLTVNQLLEMVR